MIRDAMSVLLWREGEARASKPTWNCPAGRELKAQTLTHAPLLPRENIWHDGAGDWYIPDDLIIYPPILYLGGENWGMSHTVRQKSKLLGRVRRIRGQVEALERALEAEKGCAEVLHQIAAVRGAINGLMAEVLEDHVRTHIADPEIASDAERRQGADELVHVLRAYLK